VTSMKANPTEVAPGSEEAEAAAQPSESVTLMGGEPADEERGERDMAAAAANMEEGGDTTLSRLLLPAGEAKPLPPRAAATAFI
jgi:hypothetical protein